MGRGKRQHTIQLGSSNGRIRLAPVIRPPEPRISPNTKALLVTALIDAGLERDHLDEGDLDRLFNIFDQADGSDEARVHLTVAIFTGELLEIEEETEYCDRCDKIVRAGHGLFTEDEDDQERLCLGCHASAILES